MQAKYNRANGYEADCEVIYGDTDSVMVNFKVGTALDCGGVLLSFRVRRLRQVSTGSAMTR